MDESTKMQLRESYSMQRIDDEFEEAGKRLAELEQAEKELGETQLLLIEEQERNQRLIQRLAEVERDREVAYEKWQKKYQYLKDTMALTRCFECGTLVHETSPRSRCCMCEYGRANFNERENKQLRQQLNGDNQ